MPLVLAIFWSVSVAAQNIVPVKVKAVIAGDQAGTSIRDVTALNGKVYFAANNGTTGWEPWVTDGTAAGTVMLKDCFPGTESGTGGFFPVALGTKVFFTAKTANNVEEVFVTDGTPQGTVPFPAFTPLSPEFIPPHTAVWNNMLYCGCHPLITWMGSSTRYKGLCRTDGTAAGTVVVDTEQNQGDSPNWLTVLGSKLLFSQGTPPASPTATWANNQELWMSDGIPTEAITIIGQEHTRLLKEIAPDQLPSRPFYLTPFQGKVYFSAIGPADGSLLPTRQLYVSDGTPAGTVKIWEKNTEAGMDGSNPGYFAALTSQHLLYVASAGTGAVDPFSDRDLWYMTLNDKSAPSFTKLLDINPGGESTVVSPIKLGSHVYYSASNLAPGSGRFIDVTATPILQLGTMRVTASEIVPPAQDSKLPPLKADRVNDATVVSGRLWFNASYGASGTSPSTKLFAYEPTTKIFRWITTGSKVENSNPMTMWSAPLGNSLIFLANYDNAGFALWKATW